MKKLLPKTAAIIGMIFTLICAFYLIKAAAYYHFPDFFGDAGEMSWGSALFAILVSVFSLIFYGIDAFLCVLAAVDNKDRAFNIILSSVFFICFLLGIWVIASVLRNYKTIGFYIVYFLLFILEIISIVRLFLRKETKLERQ